MSIDLEHPLRERLIRLLKPCLPSGVAWPRQVEPALFLLPGSTALNGLSCYINDYDDLLEFSLTARSEGYATNALHASLDLIGNGHEPIFQVTSDLREDLNFGGPLGESDDHPAQKMLFSAIQAFREQVLAAQTPVAKP